MKVSIYALCDPRKRVVRYIGQTSDPERRLYQYIMGAKRYVRRGRRVTGEVQGNRGLANWLGDLVEFGVDPELYILEVTSEQQAVAQEKRWTDYFEKRGFPLLNRRRIVNNSWVVKRKRPVPNTTDRLLDCLAEKNGKK